MGRLLPAHAARGFATSFDGLTYIASYGDLIIALGADATAGAGHYITNGGAEGRSAAFDGLEYTASYRDLIAAFGINEQAAIHQRIPARLTRAR